MLLRELFDGALEALLGTPFTGLAEARLEQELDAHGEDC
jgi:hypothetical protein